MDNQKIGSVIHTLRKERGLTQVQLAALLHVSDKAVSKWERGGGCPDVSLLTQLSETFEVSLEVLLSGDLSAKDLVGGNMKKLVFYVCAQCGNLMTAAAPATISCCGRKLAPMQPAKAAFDEKLHVEKIENDYFITADHPMTKDHHISFVALLTGDTVLLRRQYPEWDLQTRLPAMSRGMLVWHCTQHGLFYQLLV